MNKAYVKCFIQKHVPSVKFETASASGIPHPENHVHCVVPESDLYALEKAARTIGFRAVWPLCPNIGGQHRIIEV